MCFQPFSSPYDKVAGLAMQNPVEAVAHARMRAGRPDWVSSEDLHES
jgi:hypothetical protein